LNFGFQDTREGEASRPVVLVERELDRREDGIVHLADDQAEDVEERAFRRVFAGHDVEERLALLCAGPFLDDGLGLAVALVERTREANGHDEGKSVEPGVLEVPPGDAHPEQALAGSVGRLGVEVTGAAERTSAVLDPLALKAPVCLSHGILPVECASYS
jgi:hypothetical protein